MKILYSGMIGVEQNVLTLGPTFQYIPLFQINYFLNEHVKDVVTDLKINKSVTGV